MGLKRKANETSKEKGVDQLEEGSLFDATVPTAAAREPASVDRHPGQALSLPVSADRSAGEDSKADVAKSLQNATVSDKVAQVNDSRKVPGRKLYQDEVYGTEELSPLAVALIDTPEFQRLSHIYQLGFTYAAFRGATHPRLDHSIGTYFMCRNLMRRIVQNHARLYPGDREAFAHPGLSLSPRLYAEAPATPGKFQSLYSPMGRWRGLTELVSAAALLHDLGHIPVGHTLEDEFSVFEEHDRLGGPRLFELLYGPRKLLEPAPNRLAGIVRADHYFGPIDESRLPRPEPWEQRVPLPWVFEDGIFERFFPDADVPNRFAQAPKGLMNWEIRDLIYLILSFKETITEEEFKEFQDLLDSASKKADEGKDTSKSCRLNFIRGLHSYYSQPVGLGPDYEAYPLFYPYMADIIGNTICADLLDYLVRDGKRLKLDIRDNPRLQRYLVIRRGSSFVRPAPTGQGALRLTINAVYKKGLPRRDTVSDLLDLMRERYRFSEVVYYHPKKAAFSSMLAKALELCPNEHRPRDGEGIYPAPWVDTTLAAPATPHVTHFGDESLLAHLSRSNERNLAKTAAETLVRHIEFRNEYRLLLTLDYQAAGAAGGALKFIHDLRSTKGDTKDYGRREQEKLLRRFVERSGVGAWGLDEAPPVLIYCPNIRMQAKEVAAHVELLPGRVTPLNRQEDDATLKDEIRLLNKKYQALWRLYLFVHPKLVPWTDVDAERSMLLSTVIDAFCHKYGVKELNRERGARYPYVPFENRLDKYFDKWIGRLPESFPGDEIRRRATNLCLWEALLGLPEAPYPVSELEYNQGFERAATVVAADFATVRQREEWPAELKGFSGDEWHRDAPIPTVDTRRQWALKNIDQLGASMLSGNPKDRQAMDWEAFKQRVALGLRA